MSGLFNGIQYALRGFGLIMQPRLRLFVLMPLLINTCLFSLGIWLVVSQLDQWITHLLPSWLVWLEWVVWPLLASVIFLAVFYTFSILANLLAAPFNALLAEQVEAYLQGLPLPPFQGVSSLLGIMGRTFKSELSKLWYMSKWMLLIVIITLTPGLNLLAPFAWIWFGAWILAVEYVDYPMGNHEFYFKDELSALRLYRSTAMGFGAVISGLMVIPVINFIAMPVGVAGATAFWVDKIAPHHRQRS